MLRALKDLVPDVEKVVKLQYVFQPLHVKHSLWFFITNHIYTFFYVVCSSEEAKASKKVSPDYCLFSFPFLSFPFRHDDEVTDYTVLYNLTEIFDTTVQQWRGKAAEETAH